MGQLTQRKTFLPFNFPFKIRKIWKAVREIWIWVIRICIDSTFIAAVLVGHFLLHWFATWLICWRTYITLKKNYIFSKNNEGFIAGTPKFKLENIIVVSCGSYYSLIVPSPVWGAPLATAVWVGKSSSRRHFWKCCLDFCHLTSPKWQFQESSDTPQYCCGGHAFL